MKEYKKVNQKRDMKQKRIVALFCTSIAVIMLSILLLRTTSAQAAPAELTNKYYTSIRVEAGDTLWTIAANYITDEYKDRNEYIEEVCYINHISQNEIHAGQYLVVPYYASVPNVNNN